jgi:DNA repair protein RadC
LIADLPAAERPRERLAALGTAALADRELLAVLLGTGGAPGVGVHTLAERLLAHLGSVATLARAHPADLASVSGVGPAKAAVLSAAFELGRRATTVDAPQTISGAADIAAVVAPLLRGRTRERLVVVTCDRANRVLGCDVLSEGSADRSLMPVREVMVAVLRRDGKALALAHNHPSGDPRPSRDDIDATVQVRQAAHAVGLRFIDHVVVTDTAWRPVPNGPHHLLRRTARS